METNTLIGIITSIGILGGSLGTLIITKTIEYFSEKRTFKHELQRQFYTKKLEATEKAINFFVQVITYYTAVLISFRLFINNGDKSCISEILEDVLKKLEHLSNTGVEQISLMELYFDIKPDMNYPPDNIPEMMSYLSDLSKYNNIEEWDIKLKEEIKQILEELNKCVVFEINKCNYYLKIIRAEFRKYDM